MINMSAFTYSNSNRNIHDTEWINNCFKLIDKFIEQNKCIVYGSKALLLAFNYYNIKNIPNIKNADIDLYSIKPKYDISLLYNLIIKQDYCWSAKIIAARNNGTFTLFVNEVKFVDCTYIDKFIYDNILTLKYNNIKFCNVYCILSDYLSIMSDNESKYIIDKTINKINLINSFFSFKKQNITSEFNFDYNMLVNLNNLLQSKINNNNIDYLKILFKTPIINIDNNGNCININNVELIQDNCNMINKTINGNKNDLPYFYKYTENINTYCFTGSIVCFLLAHKFKYNIPLYNKIEIYVTNINYYIPYFCKLTNNNIQIELGYKWGTLFNTFVKLTFDQYEIYLYELSKQRYYFIYNSFPCSNFMFLFSHLLINATIFDNYNYNIYIAILNKLVELQNKYLLDNIFINNNCINIGLFEAQHKYNNMIYDDKFN